MNQPYEDGYEIIKKALEGDTDDRLYPLWIARCQDKSFYEFKAEILTPEKSSEEILSKVENILDNYTFQEVGI